MHCSKRKKEWQCTAHKEKIWGREERSKIIICGETQSNTAGGILHLPISGTLQKGTYGS